MERRVDDLDRAWRESGFELPPVNGLHLQRVQPVEFHAADGRLQVKPHHLLVPLPGALPDRAFDRIESHLSR